MSAGSRCRRARGRIAISLSREGAGDGTGDWLAHRKRSASLVRRVLSSSMAFTRSVRTALGEGQQERGRVSVDSGPLRSAGPHGEQSARERVAAALTRQKGELETAPLELDPALVGGLLELGHGRPEGRELERERMVVALGHRGEGGLGRGASLVVVDGARWRCPGRKGLRRVCVSDRRAGTRRTVSSHAQPGVHP